MKVWSSIGKMISSKKVNLEVTLKLVKIHCLNLSDKLDYVDLTIVWERGPHKYTSTPYELNYLDYDEEMKDVFRRITSFNKLKDNTWEQSPSTFRLI